MDFVSARWVSLHPGTDITGSFGSDGSSPRILHAGSALSRDSPVFREVLQEIERIDSATKEFKRILRRGSSAQSSLIVGKYQGNWPAPHGGYTLNWSLFGAMREDQPYNSIAFDTCHDKSFIVWYSRNVNMGATRLKSHSLPISSKTISASVLFLLRHCNRESNEGL